MRAPDTAVPVHAFCFFDYSCYCEEECDGPVIVRLVLRVCSDSSEWESKAVSQIATGNRYVVHYIGSRLPIGTA